MGSLVSLWVAEQTSETHLWLLGRSGRGAWDPWSAGDGLVTLARSDVSSAEEAAFVARGAGVHRPLRVGIFIAAEAFPKCMHLRRSLTLARSLPSYSSQPLFESPDLCFQLASDCSFVNI